MKRLFLGYDICTNFLIFIRKFSDTIKNSYTEEYSNVTSKEKLDSLSIKY